MLLSRLSNTLNLAIRGKRTMSELFSNVRTTTGWSSSLYSKIIVLFVSRARPIRLQINLTKYRWWDIVFGGISALPIAILRRNALWQIIPIDKFSNEVSVDSAASWSPSFAATKQSMVITVGSSRSVIEFDSFDDLQRAE